MEAAIAAAASSMSTTIPLRMPWAGETPTPTTCTWLPWISPIRAHILVVPTSRPTTTRFSVILTLARLHPLSLPEPGNEVPSDDRQVVEHPGAEGHDGGEVQLDPEPVSQVGEGAGEQHV